MFALAIVFLVIAVMANVAKLIHLTRLPQGDAKKRIGPVFRLNTITFTLGVAAFVMLKYLIAVVLFAASALVVFVLLTRKQTT